MLTVRRQRSRELKRDVTERRIASKEDDKEGKEINYNLLKYTRTQRFRSQWPRDQRRRSAAARLLRSWVRIPPGGMDICLL
jgi:hypothetical protein